MKNTTQERLSFTKNEILEKFPGSINCKFLKNGLILIDNKDGQKFLSLSDLTIKTDLFDDYVILKNGVIGITEGVVNYLLLPDLITRTINFYHIIDWEVLRNGMILATRNKFLTDSVGSNVKYKIYSDLTGYSYYHYVTYKEMSLFYSDLTKSSEWICENNKSYEVLKNGLIFLSDYKNGKKQFLSADFVKKSDWIKFESCKILNDTTIELYSGYDSISNLDIETFELSPWIYRKKKPWLLWPW